MKATKKAAEDFLAKEERLDVLGASVGCVRFPSRSNATLVNNAAKLGNKNVNLCTWKLMNVLQRLWCL